ncbi:hypothetical protein MWU75_07125 [Ornithinimicrobium sp. F0845]|uniref:hypothetical protein n=1 Tax=Ornithinimicrobium sp. F0845 TaxID=2926412 RepID=UPI001FF62756|nr:hypothetical protein [Ornithinimicrobium sp. F0845]MCK0111906.1 hypothetical protein [Ornithinimicrobium sp. F0845]
MSAAAAVSEQDLDLTQLRGLVADAVGRLEEWAELVDQPAWSTAVAVVIDEAEELRRQVQTAAGCAWRLLAKVRQATPTAPAVEAVPPATFAVAAATASLDAATCAIRPISTGLRGDILLPHLAQASCRATRRFLSSADRALEDLVGSVPTPKLVAGVGMGHAMSHLRLIGNGTTQMLRERVVEDDPRFGT